MAGHGLDVLQREPIGASDRQHPDLDEGIGEEHQQEDRRRQYQKIGQCFPGHVRASRFLVLGARVSCRHPRGRRQLRGGTQSTGQAPSEGASGSQQGALACTIRSRSTAACSSSTVRIGWSRRTMRSKVSM